MRDGPRSGARWWAVGEWNLRWKVTALVAIPLAVALALGSLRITNELSESNRLHAVADTIDIVPNVTTMTVVLAVVAGGQASGTLRDEDLAAADKAIADIERFLATRKLFTGRADLEDLVSVARSMLADGKSPTVSPAALRDKENQVRDDAVKVVDAVVSPISDPTVNAAKSQLIDSMTSRSTLFDELIALVELLKNPKLSETNFLVAISVERSLLEALARHFPDEDPTIADLNKGIDNRIQLVKTGLATKNLPVFDIRESMLDSVATYARVGNAATKQVTTVVHDLYNANRTAAMRDAALLAVGLLIELLLATLAARSLVRPLRLLRIAAQQMADKDLPTEIDRIKDGASVDDVVPVPMPVRTSEEVGQLARAVDNIHGQALRLAGEQAQLRLQVSDMFETLARRSKSLVDHQLGLIEAMEYEEKDPKLLEGLFRLDHLAARMRRNSDNLLILAGTKVRRTKAAPVEMGDVLRAAISEVEEYQRVKLGATPRGALTEPAASDIAHLFAELLDNALRASPPETDVKFTFAQANDQGLLIEVADRGIGIPAGDLSAINKRLEAGAAINTDTARHMGLFVVSRLAERHGLTVRMRPTFDIARDPGVTVSVHVPRDLIIGGSVLAGGKAMPPPPRPVSEPTSGQIKSVTRTAGGNMMVTVDPTAARPSLPQRQPGGSIMPEGLPQRTPSDGPEFDAPSRPAAEDRDIADPLRLPAPPSLPQREPHHPPSAGVVDDPAVTQGLPSLPQRGRHQPPSAGVVDDPAVTQGLPSLPQRGRHHPPPSEPTSGQFPTLATGAVFDRAAPDAAVDKTAADRAVFDRAAADRAASHSPGSDRVDRAAFEADADQPGGSAKHVRPDPSRTASFFQQSRSKPPAQDSLSAQQPFRSQLEPPPDEDMAGTPIFAEMMSAWLADWQQGMSTPAFESIADEGWSAAQRVAEAPVAEITESGLPQRQPGQRLIPGAVGSSADRWAGRAGTAPAPANGGPAEITGATPVEVEAEQEVAGARRDPESIRASLARHQAGVRNGRAMSTMKVTGDEGDR